MQQLVIILGLAVLGGFLLFGAFNTSGGFSNLVIEEIRFRESTGGPDIDEWVTIANRTNAPVDMTGWKMESAVGPDSPPSIGQTYHFAAGCILPPAGKISIHTGPIAGARQSTPCNQPRIHIYPKWNSPDNSATGWWDGVPEIESSIWNNKGDVAWLLKPTGGTGFFVFERVDTCNYLGNEANGVKKCR